MKKSINKIFLLSVASTSLMIGCSKPSHIESSKDKYSYDREYSFVDTLKINNLDDKDKVTKYSEAKMHSFHGISDKRTRLHPSESLIA